MYPMETQIAKECTYRFCNRTYRHNHSEEVSWAVALSEVQGRKSGDENQDREFVFLTNAFHLTSLEIAELYKNRWQVELFFKWLKQHLKIKKFWGTTENAVRIQISTAIISYCLVAIVQHDMKLERSTYEVLQILSISLTDKTYLKELFDKTNYNDVKELNSSLLPGLFD